MTIYLQYIWNFVEIQWQGSDPIANVHRHLRLSHHSLGSKTWRTSRLRDTCSWYDCIEGAVPLRRLFVTAYVVESFQRNPCIAAAVALRCAMYRSEFEDDTAKMWLYLRQEFNLVNNTDVRLVNFGIGSYLCLGSVWTCNWLQIEVACTNCGTPRFGCFGQRLANLSTTGHPTQ